MLLLDVLLLFLEELVMLLLGLILWLDPQRHGLIVLLLLDHQPWCSLLLDLILPQLQWHRAHRRVERTHLRWHFLCCSWQW